MTESRYPFFRKSFAVGVDGNFIGCLQSEPSSRHLRWPLGRAVSIPSPLAGWFATGVQIRANMQTAQLGDGRYILVENEEAQEAIQIQVGQQQDFDEIMARHDVKQRWFYRARNKRQAWDKFGRETVA